MEKDYEIFVDIFRQALSEATGYEPDRIYFKRKEEYPQTAGDRMFVECYAKDEVREVCGLYIRELFERYMCGTSMEVMIHEVIAELERMERSECMEKARQMDDYDSIKDDLFIRLLNININRVELEGAIYRVIGDIAQVLYIKLGEKDCMVTSAKIRESNLENWKRDREQVFDDAMLNTYFISPPRIYCWEKLLFDLNYPGENFMNLASEMHLKMDPMGNCLSTTKRTNGAVAIFLPGVAGRLAELMCGSFYMVFTSIHEVMIHNDSCVDVEDLRRALKDTVKDATPEEDFLSMYIYHYDRESGEFTFE